MLSSKANLVERTDSNVFDVVMPVDCLWGVCAKLLVLLGNWDFMFTLHLVGLSAPTGAS